MAESGGTVARSAPANAPLWRRADSPRKGVRMTTARSVPSVYARLGVRPVIHGSGTTTRYGGSRMRPETIEAMREAAQALVNLDELNEAAGAAIARMLGAEAAFVTAGSAAGLVLQAAACIAGDDPARIVARKRRWPQAPAISATVASFRTWRGSQLLRHPGP